MVNFTPAVNLKWGEFSISSQMGMAVSSRETHTELLAFSLIGRVTEMKTGVSFFR